VGLLAEQGQQDNRHEQKVGEKMLPPHFTQFAIDGLERRTTDGRRA
jgi:hypothetical protein